MSALDSYVEMDQGSVARTIEDSIKDAVEVREVSILALVEAVVDVNDLAQTHSI